MECKLYDGHIGNAGYGLDYNPETQKTVLAHRYAFYKAYGYYPKIVMHKCNNKACINPDHLLAGTQSENVKQSYRDGLQINPNRKLSEESVKQIYNDPRSSRAIAKDFGVSQPIISKIKRGASYKEWTGHGGSCGV